MKVYRYYRMGGTYRPAFIVAESVWKALEYLGTQGVNDVTSIEELGTVEIPREGV